MGQTAFEKFDQLDRDWYVGLAGTPFGQWMDRPKPMNHAGLANTVPKVDREAWRKAKPGELVPCIGHHAYARKAWDYRIDGIHLFWYIALTAGAIAANWSRLVAWGMG